MLATPLEVHATFDVGGRRVRTVVDGALPAGRHSVAWDGRGDDGAPAAQGVYFVRARWNGLEATQRLVRLR